VEAKNSFQGSASPWDPVAPADEYRFLVFAVLSETPLSSGAHQGSCQTHGKRRPQLCQSVQHHRPVTQTKQGMRSVRKSVTDYSYKVELLEQ